MTVILLGDSFIRRMKDELLPTGASHGIQLPGATDQRLLCGATGGNCSDITAHQTKDATQLAENMKISNHYHSIFVLTHGISMIQDLQAPHCDDTVQQLQPDIVFLDIGTNDVANMTKVSPTSVLTLVTTLTDLAFSLPCSKALISAMLPRTGHMIAPTEVFQENQQLFNRMLYHICSTSDKLVFHWPRGFETAHNFQDGVQVPRSRAVSDWSDDGVHCNAAALRQYIKRVRQAILQQAHHVLP